MGRVGGKALLYFEIVTTLALVIGVFVSYIIQPGAGVDTTGLKGADISGYTKQAAEFSWLDFFKDNLTIQVLLFSIIAGIFLSKYNRKEPVIKSLQSISKYVFKALRLVMILAPLGAFGGMAYTIGKYGLATLLPLGKLMICVYLTCLVFMFLYWDCYCVNTRSVS